MDVTAQECKQIQAEIKAAVEGIFKAHGLDAPTMKGTYGPYFKVTLQASKMVAGENGVNTRSIEAQAYAQECRWNTTLDPDAVGKEFTLDFKQYIFLGIAPKNRKYPYIFRAVADGRTIKAPERYGVVLKKADALANA